jgi:hypothetical protein
MDVLLGFAKGDFSESLVRNIFKASGYNAYVYGEWKAVSTRGVVTAEVGKGRTDHPDIRISNGGANLHFLEVKFRAHEHVRRKLHEELLEQRAYWSRIHPVSVVLVNCWRKPYFNIVDLESAQQRTSGVVYKSTPLMSAGWKLDTRIYDKAEELLESCRTWGSG